MLEKAHKRYQDISQEEKKQKARIWSRMIEKSPKIQEAKAGSA